MSPIELRAPKICKLLNTDHGPLIDLMRQARGTGRQTGFRGLGSAWIWLNRARVLANW